MFHLSQNDIEQHATVLSVFV